MRTLRPFQEKVLKTLFETDSPHVLAIAPTGSGKGVIAEEAILRTRGHCVVLVPLIALGAQLETRFQEAGISAQFLTSENRTPRAKTVILSPERWESDPQSLAETLAHATLLIVDECHCIEEWGTEFRPAYRKILKRIREQNFKRTLWLSATLPRSAGESIQRELGISFALLGEFAFPPELEWDTRYTAPQLRVQTWMKNCLDSNDNTLLFFNTRSETEKFSDLLVRSGRTATYFHAGISREEKTAILKRFRDGNITHLCATGAFGMGVDLPNLDRTFLTQVPYSPIAFVQSIGRVARFQKRGVARLYWSNEDFRWLALRSAGQPEFLNKLAQMKEFLNLPTRETKREWLSRYFL